jgi:hypothetical protein
MKASNSVTKCTSKWSGPLLIVSVCCVSVAFVWHTRIRHDNRGNQSDGPGSLRLRPLQATAIAAQCLLGSGVLSHEVIVEVAEGERLSEVAFSRSVGGVSQRDTRDPAGLVARIQIAKGGWIEVVNGPSNWCWQADAGHIERAVTLACAWVATMPGCGFERFRMSPVEDANGEVTVHFEMLPPTASGYFSVAVGRRGASFQGGL